MSRLRRALFLVFGLVLAFFVARSELEPMYRINEVGYHDDPIKGISVLLQIRRNGRGGLLIQLVPSYRSLVAGRPVPRTSELIDASWSENGDGKNILDSRGQVIARLEKGENRTHILTIYKFSQRFNDKRFGKMPHIFELSRPRHRK